MQLRRFPLCIDGNFLLQVAEEPMRRDAVLDLILTNKEGLAGNVKVKGSLDFSDHEMVKILASSQPWSLGEQTLAFSKICLVEYCRKKPWMEERPKEAG